MTHHLRLLFREYGSTFHRAAIVWGEGAEIKEERNTIGFAKFARADRCESTESEDALVSQLCIDRAMDHTIEPRPLF